MGLHCGLSTEELDILRIGASLHDIGKIGTPDRILLKLSQLDGTEWETMKEHSEIGEKILLATELEGSRQASLVVRHHHEHYNGQGYPDGRSGEAIPVQSRIVSIADSYDAMAVTRSYSRAKKHTEIMEVLRDEAGGKHDPQLLRVFCAVIECSEFKTATF
jgi:HD-GYP domain-containing protein (c-di-GMP phosphodiesterase class II)